MSRRRAAVKRDVLPDSRYSDKVVTKVINSIMLDGKKAIAEGIFYGAMDIIKEKMMRFLRERNTDFYLTMCSNILTKWAYNGIIPMYLW